MKKLILSTAVVLSLVGIQKVYSQTAQSAAGTAGTINNTVNQRPATPTTGQQSSAPIQSQNTRTSTMSDGQKAWSNHTPPSTSNSSSSNSSSDNNSRAVSSPGMGQRPSAPRPSINDRPSKP